MKISTEFAQGKLTIKLNGELDHHAAKEIIDNICREIDKTMPKLCVLDMKSIGFMDSSGIAVILKVYKRVKETGGEVSVINLSRQSRRVLNMSGMEKLVSMEEVKA